MENLFHSTGSVRWKKKKPTESGKEKEERTDKRTNERTKKEMGRMQPSANNKNITSQMHANIIWFFTRSHTCSTIYLETDFPCYVRSFYFMFMFHFLLFFVWISLSLRYGKFFFQLHYGTHAQCTSYRRNDIPDFSFLCSNKHFPILLRRPLLSWNVRASCVTVNVNVNVFPFNFESGRHLISEINRRHSVLSWSSTRTHDIFPSTFSRPTPMAEIFVLLWMKHWTCLVSEQMRFKQFWSETWILFLSDIESTYK